MLEHFPVDRSLYPLTFSVALSGPSVGTIAFSIAQSFIPTAYAFVLFLALNAVSLALGLVLVPLLKTKRS